MATDGRARSPKTWRWTPRTGEIGTGEIGALGGTRGEGRVTKRTTYPKQEGGKGTRA